MDKPFDAESYVNELPINKIKKHVRDGAITLWKYVRNVEGSNSLFVATIDELANWRKFRNLFLKYIGVQVPEIPQEGRKGRKQALRQIIHVFRERAISINRDILVSTGIERR